MTSAKEELDAINAQIEALRKEREALEQLQKAKIEKVRLQLGNVAQGVGAKHPIATAVASNIGHRVAGGLRAYIHYLDEQEAKKRETERAKAPG